MGRIQWNEILSVNIPGIDEQHKTWIELMNDLSAAMHENRSSQVLREIFIGLNRYTQTHFEHEIALLEHHQYPDVAAHQKIHRQFLEKLQSFQQRYNSGDRSLSVDLVHFMSDWLLSHIKREDQRYAQYICEQGIVSHMA